MYFSRKKQPCGIMAQLVLPITEVRGSIHGWATTLRLSGTADDPTVIIKSQKRNSAGKFTSPLVQVPEVSIHLST